MNTDLFIEMLQIDSTSGRERKLADFLADRLLTSKCRLERFDVESMKGDAPEGCGCPQNLLFLWGEPRVLFCTHLDTVPPYIPPCSESVCHPERSEGSSTQELVIRGRGTCDAKGQIFAMWEACQSLEAQGATDFGLLLLAGEETGSFGAKAFREQHPGAEWLVVGEPTDNCMASAAKGTKSFEVTFEGKAFHSGYPENGVSAIELFNDFMNALRSIRFPKDELLGDTTFNVGKLISDNPQNILSEKLTCRVYFRTTFESDEMVCNVMKNMAGPEARLRFGRPRVQDGSDIVAKDVAQWQRAMTVKAFGGDAPTRFEVLSGFETKPVSFGSDAPQLSNFKYKILCGPGSILVAHRPEEHITLADLKTAVSNYVEIYNRLTNN
jgi:acetylornithine deacetylase